MASESETGGVFMSVAVRQGFAGLQLFHDRSGDFGRDRKTDAHAAPAADPNLWHRRLGHLGVDNLAKLTTMSTGIKCQPADIKSAANATVCEACALGKQHRQPFPPSTNPPAASPLELLHTDVCGPMPTESHGGNRYFMTAIDDKTDHSWTFFLRRKSDAGPTLMEFITHIQRQT